MPQPLEPQRIWVRACHSPSTNLSPVDSIERIGGNQGNLLYQFSAYRALAATGVELHTVSYAKFDKGPVEARAERINSSCDHLVLPLSSSFRLQKTHSLNRWAELIERLTIPVTIVGVGAQLRLEDVEQNSFLPSRVTGVAPSQQEIADHEAASRRFATAVLDHSNSIGVRGEVTKRYLCYLGLPADRIDVIGCPSLYMWGPDFRMPEQPVHLTRDSRISLSFDHRIKSTAEILDRTLREYPRSTVYAQERFGIRMVVTGEETRADWAGDERFPVKTSHPLYAEHRIVYTPTAWAWIESLKEYDFGFGPRLHGTIATTLAGTPAHLLVHDSRGLEIAQHHGLPYTLTRELDGVNAQDLAGRQEYAAFNQAYPERFAGFTGFLARNGLPVSYDPAHREALAAFDARLEKPRTAPLVASDQVIATRSPGVLSKLRRLTHGIFGRRKG